MPMPKLDPSRFVEAVLADPSHKLPLPGRSRTFLTEGETIDRFDPFYAHLLADGSLRLKPRQAAADPEPQAAVQPIAPAPDGDAPSSPASPATPTAQAAPAR